MTAFARRAVAAVAIAGATAITATTLTAQQPNVQRKVLLQQDLTIPGQQAVLVEVTIPAGGREGRHTHPGTLLVHILEGTMTFEHEGRPTMSYKPGESFTAEPGKIHEGSNRGTMPIRAIAAFVVEKGKPLTTPVP